MITGYRVDRSIVTNKSTGTCVRLKGGNTVSYHRLYHYKGDALQEARRLLVINMQVNAAHRPFGNPRLKWLEDFDAAYSMDPKKNSG